MRSILVLSEDSGILLFAESYLESEDQFDSLGVYQLSSSLFALYKLSFDCGTSEEHSLKWLRKVTFDKKTSDSTIFCSINVCRMSPLTLQNSYVNCAIGSQLT